MCDPSLSDETNELVTRELCRALGRDRVRHAPSVPVRGRGVRRRRAGVVVLAANRLALGITLAVVITVGAIVALATRSWWALLAALCVHAVATSAVAAGIWQLASEPEHPPAALAARLEDEGVADPDHFFTELVGRFSDE